MSENMIFLSDSFPCKRNLLENICIKSGGVTALQYLLFLVTDLRLLKYIYNLVYICHNYVEFQRNVKHLKF